MIFFICSSILTNFFFFVIYMIFLFSNMTKILKYDNPQKTDITDIKHVFNSLIC